MRLASLAFLAATSLTAHAVTFPDQPDPAYADGTKFAAEELALALRAKNLEDAGKVAESVKAYDDFRERLAAEMAARLAHNADLSLATINPWLPEPARHQAQLEIENSIPELHSLSLRLGTQYSLQSSLIEKLGKTPSDEVAARTSGYEFLRNIQTALNLVALAQPADYRARRAVALALRADTLAEKPLASAIATARALPPPADAVAKFAAGLAQAREHLTSLTADTLALDAVCSELIVSDPARAAYWIQRAHVRLARGWRRGAVADFLVAAALAPQDDGLAALRTAIQAAPEYPASIWQEYVGLEAGKRIIAVHTLEKLGRQTPGPLAEPFERHARAALRNRARRLYACSFIGDAAPRTASLQWVQTHHVLNSAMFPVLSPEIGAAFGPELQAAGQNVSAVLAVHDRFAPLFATAEPFWRAHVDLFLRLQQPVAAAAAIEIATAIAPQADWLPLARQHLATLSAAAK
ncbi:MAG: hypothetical protein KF715_09290 [Candidatus Didemnitutus sp.]|nr:hypothetical protein [Candidatus Didemnitutus sp.]